MAGVSVATVSYVVNGRLNRVSAETRERVLEAARHLGYAPNTSARGLRQRRTERVCLVVSEIGVPTFDQLTRDLHAAADAAGYGVITMVVDSPLRAGKTLELLRQRIADGAIVAAPAEYIDGQQLAELARAGLPLVAMANSLAPQGFDVVRTPERETCGVAFDHLFGTGRRRVAFLGRHAEVEAESSERLDAYLDALRRHGVERDDELIVTGADDRVSGYRATARLLELAEPPDAIFAATDRAAISAIWAIRDSGRDVPGDVAVVGVGNLEEGLITKPALTTVGQPRLDFTKVAELLFDRLGTTESELGGREHLLPWSFIQRDSA
ncbi:LacI family DNA-binding transcriptional regulator [Flindersiella endophytica]